MRGKRRNSSLTPHLLRITPAHAGKTPMSFFSCSYSPDHPRACGENVSARFCQSVSIGSPPRMRGKHYTAYTPTGMSRITPAHAGKTFVLHVYLVTVPDHPRACGENVSNVPLPVGSRGSPPRMRGKRWKMIEYQSGERITPAHAGKTLLIHWQKEIDTDHPRACGENRRLSSTDQSMVGSPPRMRGKLPPPCCRRRIPRITPAHAGKTLRKWRISVVDPSPQPQSSLTSRKADASSGSQRAPCAAPV